MDLKNMMKQVQKMQGNMAKLKEELSSRTCSASAGGGAVDVTVTCDFVVKEVKIDPEMLKDADAEMVQEFREILMVGVRPIFRGQGRCAEATHVVPNDPIASGESADLGVPGSTVPHAVDEYHRITRADRLVGQAAALNLGDTRPGLDTSSRFGSVVIDARRTRHREGDRDDDQGDGQPRHVVSSCIGR